MNVCFKVIEKRPLDVICIYLLEERLRELSDFLKIMARNKRPYHVVSEEELNDLAESSHHQGIVMFAKKLLPIQVATYLKNDDKNSPKIILALDQIGNPHNVGAILRSAAHFGVDGILILGSSIADTSSAVKASSGGREFATIIESQDLVRDISALAKQGYSIVTTSSRAKDSYLDWKWKAKTVIILGEESYGLQDEVARLGHPIVIKGTGNVESLNVSVAGALLCQEFRRNFPL